jgi:hypothetical protein
MLDFIVLLFTFYFESSSFPRALPDISSFEEVDGCFFFACIEA